MSALKKFLLFVIVVISVSSCVFRERPGRHWLKRRDVHHYRRGNNHGGRRLWVKQYQTY